MDWLWRPILLNQGSIYFGIPFHECFCVYIARHMKSRFHLVRPTRQSYTEESFEILSIKQIQITIFALSCNQPRPDYAYQIQANLPCFMVMWNRGNVECKVDLKNGGKKEYWKTLIVFLNGLVVMEYGGMALDSVEEPIYFKVGWVLRSRCGQELRLVKCMRIGIKWIGFLHLQLVGAGIPSTDRLGGWVEFFENGIREGNFFLY